MESIRKNFPKWKVEAVYYAQDGVCARCGGSLEKGFHRHHKDGNPMNNSIDNLELLCPECHRATLGDEIEKHRQMEARILEKLNTLIDYAFEGKLSGAQVERLLEAMKLALKISRKQAKYDEGLETPPASIVLLRKLKETKILQDIYLEGFKDGVRYATQITNQKNNS